MVWDLGWWLILNKNELEHFLKHFALNPLVINLILIFYLLFNLLDTRTNHSGRQSAVQHSTKADLFSNMLLQITSTVNMLKNAEAINKIDSVTYNSLSTDKDLSLSLNEKNLFSITSENKKGIFLIQLPVKNKIYLAFIKQTSYFKHLDPRLRALEKISPESTITGLSGYDAERVSKWLYARLPSRDESRKILSNSKYRIDPRLYFWCKEGGIFFLTALRDTFICFRAYPDLVFETYSFFPVWDKEGDSRKALESR